MSNLSDIEMVKIAVLGAGVNGLTCAVKIKEKYRNFDVVVISDVFTPNTTGDGSGGLWYPYLCGNTAGHLLAKWGGETYKFLHKLWLEGDHDVSFMPIYELLRVDRGAKRPEWAGAVFGYRELDRRQLDYFSRLYSAEYAAGHTFSTFIVSPPSLLGYLYERFTRAGGRVLNNKVNSLRDPILEEYQVIVNCCGVGSRNVVPDTRVYPIRGQISKVIAPWINETIVDEDGENYIIPNAITCVLGGTHQEHNYSTQVDEKDKSLILNRCRNIVPGLKHAPILHHWVGLRPGRDEIRLESEETDRKLIIHNYGHGGSGLTLFWGCASEVLELFDKNIHKIIRNERSKL